MKIKTHAAQCQLCKTVQHRFAHGCSCWDMKLSWDTNYMRERVMHHGVIAKTLDGDVFFSFDELRDLLRDGGEITGLDGKPVRLEMLPDE